MRTFFANMREEAEITVGLSYQMSFQTLAKYAKKYQANDIVIAFDSPNSWRKLYTQDVGHCKTHKVYKGHRRQGLTPQELQKLKNIDEHLIELADIFKNYSGIITLKADHLEADDLIAGFVQRHKDDKHIIVSADKDFIQLLSNPNVSLIDPMKDKPRDLLEWDCDAKYFMFEKCFRGDAGDNVMSSYPRIRGKAIKEAYSEPVKLTNAMNHEFVVESIDKDGQLKSYNYRTADIFEENQLLMDLTMQPEGIREMIFETIDNAIVNRGKYDHFFFVKFCGKHQLVNILNNLHNFSALLSGKGRRA